MRIPLLSTWIDRAKVRRRDAERWGAIDGGDSPRVYYGYDSVPGPTDLASGGIIKCQDLNRRYPNDPDRPNILYLVSSALPPHFMEMIKAVKEGGGHVVWNQNGVAYPAWHGPGWERLNAELAGGMEAADAVVYQSEFCKLSADHFLGAPSGRYEIRHNPVDESVFVPRSESNDGREPRTLLVAGSHHESYRVRGPLEMLATLRAAGHPLTLILAGRFCWVSDADREVKSWITELGLEEAVEVRGAYPQTAAVALFHEADLLIHPKHNDPCPRLVVEALSCGLPVVYSATGGVPELVGSDAGVGVPGAETWDYIDEPDVQALSEGVLTVLEDYERFSRSAREQVVERLNVGLWLDAHTALFESLRRGDS